MDYFELFARAILRSGKHGPGSYTDSDMNVAVMSLPPAEFFARVDGNDLKMLPVVETDEELEAYIKRSFFEFMGPNLGWVPTPTLVTDQLLQLLDTYPAWQRLHGFMTTLGLEPLFVFHNQPFRRGPLTVYPADLRLGFKVGFILEEKRGQISGEEHLRIGSDQP